MKVVISILNWNSLDRTEACIQSLVKTPLTDCEICVTDNASKNFEEIRLKEILPEIIILKNDKNLGFAAGHEKALALAIQQKADALWILNNDLQVLPDTLSELMSAYQTKGEGIFGSSSLSENGEIKEEVIWEIDSGSSTKCSFSPFSKEELEHSKIKKVANIVGYSMLIPLSVIEKYGFMDPNFFLYYEETDYCLRLLKQGVPSFWVSSSKVYHIGEGSSSKHHSLKPIMEYYLYRNFFRLLKTHAPKRIVLDYLKRFCMRFLSANILRKRKVPLLSRIHILGITHAFTNKSGAFFSPENFID